MSVSLGNKEGWWSGGIPTADWENDLFSVKLSEPECCYDIAFKKPVDSLTLLLWQKGAWKRVIPAKG